MKLALPTGRSGQLLALGLPIFTLAALWLGVAMPLIEWHDDRDTALIRRFALADRMEALIATLPQLREQAAAVGTTSGSGQALLDGDNDAVASASLQERLQEMFLQAGVQLNSVETVPGEDSGTFRRIRLRMSFNASWPVLIGLLKDMHVATPLLLVDELQIQPALHRISTGARHIRCFVFGFCIPFGQGWRRQTMSRLVVPSLILSAALVATIGWEFQTAVQPEDAMAVGRHIASGPASAAPLAAPADPVEAWAATSLDRPLLREGRRPDRVAGMQRKNEDSLRLAAVITGPFGDRAIFTVPGVNKPIIARVGSQVSDFVVRSIEPGWVVVETGGLSRTFKPLFAGKTAAAEATPKRL